MPDPNVLTPEWQHEIAEAPFHGRLTMVGAAAGARELGASLFEVDPGGMISPYHLHHGNEELVIVLSGRPTLRTPEGRRALEPGAVVAFPRGPEGAHHLTNEDGERARVLIVSTMNFPDVAEHVDTGATLAIAAPGAGKVFPAGTDVPAMEAAVRAMQVRE